jgi:pimeloyl-ACP methyl ester carboxylesterase
MDFLTIQTTAGPLGFVGRLHAGQRRPSLVAVSGSFPPKGYLHDLIDQYRGANVLIVNLPGMDGVPWAPATPAQLSRGLAEAVQLLLGDSPIVAFGSSTGNLLSLGLRLPNIFHRVLVEPFFQTKDLWPFIANSRQRMERNPADAAMARYFWDVFGIGPTAFENRDYRHLLDAITVPSDVVVGQLPLLPARSVEIWPSFTSEEDRAALTANPLVTLHVGPTGTGHNINADPAADAQIKRALHAALLAGAALCTPQAKADRAPAEASKA